MFGADQLFGGGWTAETAKRIAGWRARKVDTQTTGLVIWVVGRAGKPGAFSVMVMGDKLDVATYDDLTGPQTLKRLESGVSTPADVHTVVNLPVVSGWFLQFIDGDGDVL